MLTKVTEFGGEGHYVRFHPLVNVPGFSHRVVVLDNNRKIVAKDWLTKGTRITEKVALYYLRKHTRTEVLR